VLKEKLVDRAKKYLALNGGYGSAALSELLLLIKKAMLLLSCQ